MDLDDSLARRFIENTTYLYCYIF